MKVAYNDCFGGFGLSPLALTMFAEKKGIKLTWYKKTGYRHEGNEKYERVGGVPKGGSFNLIALTDDVGEEIPSLPNDLFYYPSFYENKNRCDPDLITVIEALGSKANGECASLALADIPDGADFEISEYDGREDVVPPRMSW